MTAKHRRNRKAAKFGSITTCISTTMVLVLLGIIVLFVTVGTNYSKQLREGMTVEVMLHDSITPSQFIQTQAALRQANYSRRVVYISKEQGIKEMNDVMGNDIGSFEGYSPIPAEFEVYLKYNYANADSISVIRNIIQNLPAVTEVCYPQDIMASLDKTIPAVGFGLLILAALLAIISFALINNTMRMSVYARRYSIHTMKLVGAKWSFIRRPFIWQSLRIGLIAATLASCTLGYIIYYLRYEAGAGDIYLNELITPEVWIATLGVIYICGICLTSWCAYLSVNHHLNLKGGEVYIK